MVPSAMPIQYKPHLNAQAKEVEGKLQSSWGELSGDTGQNLQDDAQQVQACAMKVGQAVEEKFKAFVDKAKNRATQIFSPTANGSATVTASKDDVSSRRLDGQGHSSVLDDGIVRWLVNPHNFRLMPTAGGACPSPWMPLSCLLIHMIAMAT